jgi:hypothetical protein
MADELQNMEERGVASKTKARTKSTRPVFSSEARFEKLIAIFEVDSVKELDDAERFPWDVVKTKAAQLASTSGKKVMPGSVKSWERAISLLLAHADSANSPPPPADEPEPAPANAGAHGAPEEEPGADAHQNEFDQNMSSALSAVKQLLEGESLDADSVHPFTEAELTAAEKFLAQHLDTVEDGMREQIDLLLDDDTRKVADLYELFKVSVCADALSPHHLARHLHCVPHLRSCLPSDVVLSVSPE